MSNPVHSRVSVNEAKGSAARAEPQSQSRRLFLLNAAVLSLAAASPRAWAQGYQKFNAPLWAVPAPGTQEVIEFFWYGCPHCFHLEPYIENWLAAKPPAVQFRREAAPFNRLWSNHARFFYAAQRLNLLDKLHENLFKELHLRGNKIHRLDQLAAFAAGIGAIDAQTFLQTMESFSVEGDLSRVRKLLAAYNVSSVPTLIVNGNYLISANTAGSEKGMIKAVQELTGGQTTDLGVFHRSGAA